MPATANRSTFLPNRTELKRCYSIFHNLMNGGIQYTLPAPQPFHQPNRYHRDMLSEWVSVTLLTDGDLLIIISDAFLDQHPLQDIKPIVQTMLEQIQSDVALLADSLQRFNRLVGWLLLTPATVVGAGSIVSALSGLPAEWTWALNGISVYGLSGAAIALFGLGLGREAIASKLLKIGLKKWLNPK